MKTAIPATIALASVILSSCVSSGEYDTRYGNEGPRGNAASSFEFTGGIPAAAPQRTGWIVSPQVREAEKKSISHDIPYGVVGATGTVSHP